MGKDISRRDFFRFGMATSLAAATCRDLLAAEPGPMRSASSSRDLPPHSRVAMVRTGDGLETVNRAIELAGGLAFIQPGDSVLIKPAMNSSNPFPATTDPAVVSLLIDLCAARGASRIVVADKPFFLKSATAVLERTGIGPAAKASGAEVIPLDRAEWIVARESEARNWGGEFRVPALASQVDHIIYLPTVRTHFLADFTMSLKNSVGLLGAGNCMVMHLSRTLPERIAEINLALRPKFYVLDGRKVFVEGGPDSGLEKEPGIVFAGTDPVACDVMGLALLKTLGTTEALQAHSVWGQRMIQHAVRLGLGAGNTEKIDVIAEGVEEEDKIRRNLA